MKSLAEIKQSLGSQMTALSAKYPIKSLAIFGSYARNEQTKESDLDLCVEFNDKIGSQFIDLADEIEEFIGFKVDLVSKNGIKDRYFQSIKDELIYV
ncbi:MAG: nucleotidyltransferase family protein [Reichenbachiella sp.]|uniref:nucleotidyltransferase family protein n=1 Tax=Reichenbachiella sp. TaxID=2184521 RepID=UPI0029667D88|nr:nucleotidyltransferase family protein [Reichenbachiella sp.]MDW3210016.1 nucleotidyltransferase family protein [Reichenbachiella sp.]